MPYSPQHRAKTRAKIIDAARRQFNSFGYEATTIDDIMARAGLSRGGFYHHFTSKEDVFAEAVMSFLRQTFQQDKPSQTGPDLVRAVMEGYLSQAHLSEVENQCPLIAVPSDVARAGPSVRASYGAVFDAMLNLFETNLSESGKDARRQALILCSLCIGGMVLARTIAAPLGAEILAAARSAATDIGVPA